MKKGILKCSLVMAGMSVLAGNAAGQDMVAFGTDDPGENKSIDLWGLDTAFIWDAWDTVRRGVAYIGQPQLDVIRFSFTGDTPISGGDLTGSGLTEFNDRMNIVDSWCDAHTVLYLNNDTEDWTTNPYLSSGGVDAAAWAELIDVTRQKCEDAGRTVVSVAPFNEPDYGTWHGDMNRLGDVCWQLRNTYGANFSGIRLYGASTLNNDYASGWYNTLKGWGYLEEGCTHQLAGIFDTYAAFYQTVEANGDVGANDELHNVMEAMVGAEYGMDVGIWWRAAERTRCEFMLTSDGDRLGYAENRPNWTAASVYRAPSGEIQAFVGESERQALPTTYRFFSTDRPVFYDGHGPQRAYEVTTTGGPGYMTDAHRNAETMVSITWGDDVQPVVDGRYYLVNRNSHKVMEVAGGGKQDGTDIRQNAHTGATYQQWDVVPLPPDEGWGDYAYFTLKPAHRSSSAADVYGWSHDNGGNIAQWSYGSGANQHWFLEYVDDGYFTINSRWSTKSMCVSGGSTANGASIIQSTDDASANFQWRLVPVTADPTDFTAPAAPSGVSATANPASVQLNWNASAEGDLDGYTVMRSTTSGGPYDIIARGLTTTSYLDSSANQAIPYYYVVKAVDESLNRSANSTEVSATPTGGTDAVAQYGFDGDLNDASGNGNNAVAYGTSALGAGIIGSGSLDLAAQNGRLELPSEVANHDQLTITAWVNWSGGSAWQRIFDFGNGTDSYLFLTPANADGVTMQFTIHHNGISHDLLAPALTAFQWAHVAVTLDNQNATLYVNGASLASSSTFTIKPSDFNPAINYIGKSQYPADPLFKGSIDDFRIYNYALSQPEIATLADTYVPPPTQVPITLVNPGFELPDAGKIQDGFDGAIDIPGWNNDDPMYDSGIEAAGAGPGAYEGQYSATMRGPVSWDGTPAYRAYQLTSHAIAAGETFKVDFAAAANWIESGSGQMSVSLYYDNGGSRVTMNTVTVSGLTVGGGWTPGTLSVDADAYPASIGHDIGIEFWNSGGSWTSIDDFSLTVSNNVTDTTPPGAPTGLGAAAGDGSVSLDWTDNAEPDLASYTVYRSTTSSTGYSAIASGLGASAYVDNTVANGTAYYYVVTATDTTSNESGNSDEVSVTPQVPAPAAPTGLDATAISDTQIDLSWGVSSGAVSYIVKRSGSPEGPYTTVATPAVTSYSDTGLPASTTYYYVVSAVNTGGESPDSVPASTTTQDPPDTTPPAAPTGLTAVGGDGSVGLDWADNTEEDLDSYTVYRSTTSNGTYDAVASGLTVSTNTDNTVTNGIRYYYVVTATDSNANESAFSSPPVSAVPSAPIAPEEYHIADIVVDAGTNVTLTVSNSVLGHTYWMLAADELASPTVWSNILDEAGTGSDLLFGIPIDPASTNRFFKLDVQRQ